MGHQKIPTIQQLFGAYNNLFELILKQPSRQAGERDPVWFGMHLGHETEGTLTSIGLRGEAAEAYGRLETMLWAATHWGRRGNTDRLRRQLQRFLLEMALDPGPPGVGRALIKQKCIAELEEQLGGKVRRWKIMIRVPVRLHSQEDVRLVGLRFRSMTEVQQKRLRLQIRRDLGSNKRHADTMADQFKCLVGRDVTCEVMVEARDAKHAFFIAQELVTDRLEFFAGIVALIRKPTDQKNDPRRREGPGVAIEVGAGSGEGYGWGAATDEVDLTTIIDMVDAPQVRHLLRLLEKKALTEGENRLLNALRWSGRSRRADTETSAFLYGAIAYETILGGANGMSISYSLRLRCAHLLGARRATRRSILHSVKDLYGKRSAIVHAGTNGVELDELTTLWRLLNRVLLAYIERRFHRKTNAEIEEWFENRIL